MNRLNGSIVFRSSLTENLEFFFSRFLILIILAWWLQWKVVGKNWIIILHFKSMTFTTCLRNFFESVLKKIICWELLITLFCNKWKNWDKSQMQFYALLHIFNFFSTKILDKQFSNWLLTMMYMNIESKEIQSSAQYIRAHNKFFIFYNI